MRARFTDPINEALERIFSASLATDLRLRKLIPALSGKPPDIRFQKGGSDVHHNLLSSGEKEVFNIILNLFTRREHFPNAIYFIDELDVHLHTGLQYALVKEIVERWIAENSQLWTASHSLGFIDYASSSDDAAILDFDDLDFDQPQTLQPASKSEHIFDIAVPRSSALKVATVRDRLLVNLRGSRGSYEIIQEFSKELKDQAIQELGQATASSDFETFYPFLDMKKNRPTAYLAGFNLRPIDFATTRWMRDAIAGLVA